ncbi:MAG: peptidase domain-containing ABC transporter [Bacteroidales bacterium]|nr:peptidase domain-containing ABC transporter [Bacteroidales bacterium]MDY0217404.1 peptidase domain-containing ABC transporter [Bacteroidales bacterium]
MSFPFYTQPDAKDCGPVCLRMIAKHYGKNYSLQNLRDKSFITREGVSLLGISDAAESLGFKTIGVRIPIEKLINEAALPCIAHWKQNHFVVLYKISKNGNFHVADPAHGLIKYTKEEFLLGWLSTKKDGEDSGIALLLEPTNDFYEHDGDKTNKQKISYFFKYLRPYKGLMIQLILAMVAGSLLQLIFPFLTQAVVDVGIGTSNLNFITLALIAQLVLFISQMSVGFIRSWILLHISTRINISLISDFLIKLMKLPIGFFDTKMIGDIMQRIGDHARIESFLTGSSIRTLFSFVNFIVFGAVLAYYSLWVLAVFLIGNTLYVLWVLYFMRYRRDLDFKRFAAASQEQSNVIQLITGMQEIKLNNCEKQKRWTWERIQAKLFKINIKGLALGQYQELGSMFFSQTTSIFITFLAAQSVIKGDMTIGMMMSLTYIIGQLSAPISEFIGFARAMQDAKISLERLAEIHQKEDEEEASSTQIDILPEVKTMEISNLSFSYDGADRDYVLDDINLTIPERKVTAIVGASGSGKTTLVKLLLGFYQLNKGDIKIGETSLKNINPHVWRSKTGAVMQDGFIFSDSIADNITVSDESPDKTRLLHAVKAANIQDFVESLPLGYNTKIGQEGNGVSQGQRQRILIARVIYKNPEFIFFDEATNALDANNEKIIMQNLDEFFKGKTVVVVAHRLSTVKNADKIIVMEKGKIIEEGTHSDLTKKRGAYYELVKNQLELGN